MKSPQVVDARFIPIAIAIWLSESITVIVGLQRNSSELILWLTIFCFALLGTIWIHNRNHINFSAITKVIIAGAVLGVGLSFLRIWPITHSSVNTQIASRSIVDFRATVTGDFHELVGKDKLTWNSSKRVSLPIRLESISSSSKSFRIRVPAQLFAARFVDQYQQLTPGTRFSAVGRLDPVRPGTALGAYVTAISQPKVISQPPRYQWLASSLRARLVQALACTPNDAKALVPGLALGDTSAVKPELLAAMQTAGLTHLVAVSGANVTILLALVFACLARTSRFTRVIIATLVLCAFVVVVRPQPSVLRASAMGLVMLLGILGKRKTDALNALGLAVVFLLIVDPLLSATYGFTLSVFATTGLIVVSPKLRTLLAKRLPTVIPSWIVDGLVVTICAQIAVLPVLLQLGARFSLAAIPANLLAVPLASVTMVLGLILTALSVICLPIAQVFAWVVAVPALAIAFIARVASSVKFLIVPMPAGIAGAVLATVFLLFALICSRFWTTFKPAQKSLVTLTTIVGLSALWLHPTAQLSMWPPSNWMLVSCDVGQGDATVINLGHHEAIVVDVGPDPVLLDNCLSRLHIRFIPLLILTHFHADHVAGIDAAFHHRRVGTIRVTSLGEPPLTTNFVTSFLASKSAHFQAMTAGEHLVLGQVDIQCLWPAELIRGQGSDANNASIVLLVTIKGFRFLLAADVEAPAQHEITQRFKLPHVDVLKVAHHGSRNQDALFARQLSPDIALFSVGKGNDYGHPATETLMLYELLRARIYRTDLSGSVAIVESGGRLQAMTSH